MAPHPSAHTRVRSTRHPEQVHGAHPGDGADLAGIVVGLLGGWPGWIHDVLAPIGTTLTPLALFSVGLQLTFRLGRGQAAAVGAGLGWKLLLAPLLCWALGTAAGVGGLLLILSPWRQAPYLVSSLLALAAGLFWALSVLVAKTIPVRDAWDLLSLTAWQMMLGAVPLVAIAVIFPGRGVDWTPAYLGALAYNIVPANALAWLLWLFVVGRLPVSVSGLGSLATPVVGVLAAWLQLGERPQPEEAAGMLLVLLALAALSLPLRRHR